MTETTTVPTIALNNGTAIPQLGFGVFKVDPGQADGIVANALEAGYRHIDTAAAYHNEEGVGRGVAESGIDRADLFITTKLWNDQQANAPEAFDASLERLGLDYVDLYLIHWPAPERDTFVQAWKALEQIAESGRAKAIGVCNFLVPQLERLIQETDVVPAVNQIELHVDFQQDELRRFNAEHAVATEAWGPLGQGTINDSPELAAIAAEYDKTVAQTILRWHIQIGNVVIPKSNHRERMAENFDIFDFQLADAQMATIARLDKGEAGRNSSHPRDVN